MSTGAVVHVALVLPVTSAREAMAAIQVVMHVLRQGRVELDLVREPRQGQDAPTTGFASTTLFISADVPLEDAGPETRDAFERDLRDTIERRYARQGIQPVAYDLQLLGR